MKSVYGDITYLRSLLSFSNLRLPDVDTIEPYGGKLGSPALITVIGGDTDLATISVQAGSFAGPSACRHCPDLCIRRV